MWQSLAERNERVKLQKENAAAGASVERQIKEAEDLKLKLQEERRRAVEAEDSAR